MISGKWANYDWINKAKDWGFTIVVDFAGDLPLEDFAYSNHSSGYSRLSYRKENKIFLWQGSTDYLMELLLEEKKKLAWDDLSVAVRANVIDYHFLVHKKDSLKDSEILDFFDLLKTFKNNEQDLIPADYLERLLAGKTND